MRLLPDTQLLVWSAERPDHVPASAMAMLQNRDHEVYFSLVSIWEVAIKLALKRSDFETDPRYLREGLLRLGFRELGVLPEHLFKLSNLPMLHRDPFDRLLVAQAQVEGVTLMTTDKKLARYGPFVRRF